VLGFALVLLIERFPPSRYARPFFAVGFLGAYTTMSTFMVETALLVRDGRVAIAAMYVAASMVAGFGAVWLGITAGRAVPRSVARR
jgi:fluoride exporter